MAHHNQQTPGHEEKVRRTIEHGESHGGLHHTPGSHMHTDGTVETYHESPHGVQSPYPSIGTREGPEHGKQKEDY